MEETETELGRRWTWTDSIQEFLGECRGELVRLVLRKLWPGSLLPLALYLPQSLRPASRGSLSIRESSR